MKQCSQFCVAFGLLILSGCIVTKSSYVERGNKFFEAGKYAEASINYRKAIQKDSRYGEAYYRLGLTAIKQQEPRQAYEALTRAVDLMPSNVDAKENLESILLSFYLVDTSHPKSLYDQLLRISDELLASNANSFEALKTKGYIALTDRKPVESIAYFRKALQLKRDPALKTTLAEVLMRDGQLEEGEKTALGAIADDKTYSPAYNTLYTLYVSTKRMAEAEKILQTRIANNPKNATFVIQLAEHYADVHDEANMAKTLQGLLERSKEFPNARLEVADFYASRKRFPEATRYYEEGIEANSSDKIMYQQRLVGLLLNQGKQQDGLKLIDKILQEHPNDEPSLRLRASLWVDSGQSANLNGAIRDLQTLLKQSPGNPFLLFKLGQAQRRTGDVDEAVNNFLQAVKNGPAYQPPRYELAEIALQRGQGKQAVQYSSEILAAQPNDKGARLLHATGLIATREYDAAKGELTALLKDDSHFVQAQFQLGRALMEEHNYSEATPLFEKLRQDSSMGALANSALASIYSSEKQSGKAIQVLQDQLKKSPDAAAARAELAVIEVRNGNYESAIKEFQQVLAADPKSVKTWLALAETYDLNGDFDNSITAYKTAQQLAPKDVVPAISLASVLQKSGRTAEAKSAYEEVLKTDPNNLSALNNLAFMLCELPDGLDQALALAQRAVQMAPQEPGVLDTLGYIYLKKNMVETALRTFAVLAQKYPTHSTFRYHLGMALLAQGNKTKAAAEFKAALANHPTPQEEAKITKLLRNNS